MTEPLVIYEKPKSKLKRARKRASPKKQHAVLLLRRIVPCTSQFAAEQAVAAGLSIRTLQSAYTDARVKLVGKRGSKKRLERGEGFVPLTESPLPLNPVQPSPLKSKGSSAFVNVDDINFDNVQFIAVTGPAGSGKSYAIHQRSNPRWKLTAMTGHAATIMGDDAQTIHSTLRFFNLDELKQKEADGTLLTKFQELRHDFDKIVIDKASMINREMLEILVRVCEQTGMGLILIADFCQLPPIGGDWAFESDDWSKFTVVKMTSQYRTTHLDFLTAQNLLRAGRGAEAVPHLKAAGVQFEEEACADHFVFPGLTLVSRNSAARSINVTQLKSLAGEAKTYKAARWGWASQHKKLWRDIPEKVTLKVGAPVMVVRNLYGNDNKLAQANGDRGTVLALNNNSVTVERTDGKVIEVSMDTNTDGGKGAKAVNGVRYMPLQLAWGLTVDKAQGQTITSPLQIQLYSSDWWRPATLYVACSRVQDPKHLVITGSIDTFVRHCQMDKDCSKWL